MKCYEARNLILDGCGIFKLRERAAILSDLLELGSTRNMIKIARENLGEDFLNFERVENWTQEEREVMWEILRKNLEPSSYTGKVFFLLSDFLEHILTLFLPHIKSCKPCLNFLLFVSPEVLYEGLYFEITERETKEILRGIKIGEYETDILTFIEKIWGRRPKKEIECDEFKLGVERILREIIERRKIEKEKVKNYFYHFYYCESCEEILLEKASSLNQLYYDL